MSRGWVWLQLGIAWLPMWALFTALIMIVHGSTFGDAAIGSARMITPGALLGVVVYRLLSRTPLPHPLRLRFIVLHVLAALLYATVWYALISLIDSIVVGHFTFMLGRGFSIFVFTGVWLYLIIAAVTYANLAAQRTAQMQAHAARMQLDALRTQLHPHFLFNALHAVYVAVEVVWFGMLNMSVFGSGEPLPRSFSLNRTVLLSPSVSDAMSTLLRK